LRNNYSDYVIYVDESGDHGLSSIDINHPIFVLVFCIFKKSDYINKVAPLVQKLKFDYFGHDSVILHSSDIRKSREDFTFLFDRSVKESFLSSISKMINDAKFSITSTTIDKKKLKQKHIESENPYEIALRSCIEKVYDFLKDKNQHQKTTHIVIEKRGKDEDKSLELAFRRIVQGDNFKNEYLLGLNLPFEIVFADKKVNSSGLQIADLCAYPIAKKYLKPELEDKAYDIVKNKIYANVVLP